MIKHFENKKTGQVIAIAEGCEMDAIKKIVKRFPYIYCCTCNICEEYKAGIKLPYGLERAIMPTTFRAVATCAEGDTYSFETGREVADKKLMAKFKKAEDKAITKWVTHMEKMLAHVDLTFDKK